LSVKQCSFCCYSILLLKCTIHITLLEIIRNGIFCHSNYFALMFICGYGLA